MKRLFAALLLVTLPSVSQAGTVLQEYIKAQQGGYLSDYRASIARDAGPALKEQFDRIDRAGPGDTYRDTDGRNYVKRCGYGGTDCTWNPLD